MTAIDFPSNPTTGQTVVVGQRTWSWSGSVWESDNDRAFVRTVSDTAPSAPVLGDEWFNSETGRLYTYYDSYWIEIGTSVSGQNGASAYELAVENGFVGTEQQWLDSLATTGKAIAMAIVFGG